MAGRAGGGPCLEKAAALVAIMDLQSVSLSTALDVLVKAQLLQAGAW